jgi:Leucine rich repeat variant
MWLAVSTGVAKTKFGGEMLLPFTTIIFCLLFVSLIANWESSQKRRRGMSFKNRGKPFRAAINKQARTNVWPHLWRFSKAALTSSLSLASRNGPMPKTNNGTQQSHPDETNFRENNIPEVFGRPADPNDVSLASDPTMHPNVLRRLAKQHWQTCIRRCLASNPNTPTDLLLELAKSFPYEVAENTMFMMMQIENPDLIEHIDAGVLMAILHHKNVPQVFIRGAASHHDHTVLITLVGKFDLSETQLEQLIEKTEHVALAKKIVQHGNLTNRLKYKIANGDNHYCQEMLAQQCLKNPEEPAELLSILFENVSIDTQVGILQDRRIATMPIEKFFTLNNPQRNYQVAVAIASGQWSDGSFPEGVALHLIQNHSSCYFTRRTLVIEDLPDSVLEVLGRDPHEKVRAGVAKLANLPEEILFRLAADDSNIVQRNLAKNRNIQSERLIKLSSSSHQQVLRLLARHPNTPVSVLQNIAQQPLGHNHIALTQNPGIPSDIIAVILAKLSVDPRYTVRKLVARHPQATQELLTQLAQDPETKVASLAQLRLTA